MMQTLRLGPVRIEGSQSLPPALAPLVLAAESGMDLVPEIISVARNFGFDAFTYCVATNPRPGHETCIYEFTTLPFEWSTRYDQEAYIEVDPQVAETWNRTVPFVWDQSTVRGYSPKVDAFLDDALRHGIASGVSLPLHDATGTRIRVVLNSGDPALDKQRRDAIIRRLGDMSILARYFDALFLRGAIEKGLPPRNAGIALSARERECLALAARGLSNDAIGKELGIAANAAQFHFASIRSKLLAANWREAVARAISQGQITV